MYILVRSKEKETLKENGLEILGGDRRFPEKLRFEEFSSLKFCHVEHGTNIGAFSYAVSGFLAGVAIGRYCSFGENVQIGRQNHPLDWLSTSPFLYIKSINVANISKKISKNIGTEKTFKFSKPATQLKRTIIENDVWIGQSAIVNAGVKISTGAIVAAGSVVVKDVEPYSIVGGNPAMHLRYRIPTKYIDQLLNIKWWEYPPSVISTFDASDILESIEKIKNIDDSSKYLINFRTIEEVLQ